MNPAKLSAALALLAVSIPLVAQPTASSPFTSLERYTLEYAYPGSQLKDYIYARSKRHFERGEAEKDALKTPADVQARQKAIRAFIADSVGGLPANTPLNARVTGTATAASGVTIENVLFESRPHHYVTANLYLPAERTGRTAAVLFLCGHHNTAKQVAEYQIVCQTLAQAGLIVFAQDPIGQGERLSYYEADKKTATIRAGTGEHDYAGAQLRFVGDNLARYMLHDAMRSVDYLLTRPEVDPARIGVTGNSGGGTQSCLIMLADPRLAAAAPATFIMNRETYQWTGQAQDAEQIWDGFTRAGYDHEDVLLALAPKPVLVLAVTSDFFPIEGTRRTVTRARHAWDIFKKGDALALFEDQVTHMYTPKMANAAAQFFARHLLKPVDHAQGRRKIDPATLRPQPLPPEKLSVTKSGQVRGELADAEFAFDANFARWREFEAARRALPEAERKTRAIGWLRERVFRERDAVDLNVRRIDRERDLGELKLDIAFWWSQPRLANLGMLFRAKGATDAKRPVTIALWDDGTRALVKHEAWIREECARGRAVLVVNLSGMGPLKPDAINSRPETGFYETMHKLADDLAWMGDSFVALRTYEVLRVLDVLREWPELATNDVRIFAEGRAGVHGRLATALDPRIAACDWRGGFLFADFVRSRTYEPVGIKQLIFPGVLRYFDLNEL
jgi:dienelactone hydrolase